MTPQDSPLEGRRVLLVLAWVVLFFIGGFTGYWFTRDRGRSVVDIVSTPPLAVSSRLKAVLVRGTSGGYWVMFYDPETKDFVGSPISVDISTLEGQEDE